MNLNAVEGELLQYKQAIIQLLKRYVSKKNHDNDSTPSTLMGKERVRVRS